ncbi:uncharacterized protein LOC117643599 [Thrips palmi]|uniref:Uncharacterized protein LOC117643599 n=1 Tax=Thrips palmi TaxID=161013 RepID=A0A6P8YNN3_THRPL|nr:uncharacterized protein LOC117643599 [Thrips palmi]
MYTQVGVVPPCDTSQLACLQDVHATRLLLPPLGFPDDGLTRRGINCSHCIAACDFVSFDSHITTVQGAPGVSRAGSLDIFMDARRPATKHLVTRDYSLHRRLTIIGGIGGLCLGMSSVSVVELVHCLAKALAVLAAHAWRLCRRRRERRHVVASLLVLPRPPSGAPA